MQERSKSDFARSRATAAQNWRVNAVRSAQTTFFFNRIIHNDAIPASSRSSFTFQVEDPASGETREARMTVAALDDHTVQIVLSVAFAPFLRAMGTAIYPKHVKDSHEQWLTDIESDHPAVAKMIDVTREIHLDGAAAYLCYIHVKDKMDARESCAAKLATNFVKMKSVF